MPTPWDVIQIVKHTGLNPYDFLDFVPPEVVEDVPKADPTWLRCKGQRYMMALKRGKNGCFFRDVEKGCCAAYEHRPILCRLFPFRVQHTRDGKFRGFSLHPNGKVGCPRHRDGSVDTEPLYKLFRKDCTHQDDYQDLVAVFNRKRSKTKQPRDFIQLFIKWVPL